MKSQIVSRQILEFRSDAGTIYLQGTEEGLAWLAQKCFVLIDAGTRNHLHLDDCFVLTSHSKAAVLEFLPRDCSKVESVINKFTKFVRPDFSENQLEFRENPKSIYIYGTAKGLRWLAQKCLVLVDAGKKDHLHLQDYHVLTKASKPAALAQFP